MKRVLIISTRPIESVSGGDALRIGNVKKYLSKFYDVHTICLKTCLLQRKPVTLEGNVTYIYLTYWQIFQNIVYSLITLQSMQRYYYFTPVLVTYLDSCASKYDKVILHLSRLHFLKDILQKHNCRTIMELTDALSSMYQDAVQLGRYMSVKSLAYRYENIFYPKLEKEVCNSYPAVIVCGSLDYHKLTQIGRNLYHFGNGVEIPRLENVKSASKNSVVFVGNLRTLQNQEGIKNFYWYCHRNNLAKRGIKLKIVGHCPYSLRRYFKNKKNVEVLGFVDDLQSVMAEAICGINPIEIGAGIQNKNLLIASYAVPVVSLNRSLQRLHLDKCFIGCDCFEEMSTKITNLFQDETQAKLLGQEARKFVEKYYSWDNALSGYENV